MEKSQVTLALFRSDETLQCLIVAFIFLRNIF